MKAVFRITHFAVLFSLKKSQEAKMLKQSQPTALTISLVFLIALCIGEASALDQSPSGLHSNSELAVKSSEANNTLVSSPSHFITSTVESTAETELKILKEKNALISDFQSSLISIVTWSLTAIVSVVLLLAGASTFTNIKLNERDIKRIKLDYDAKIKVFRSEIAASLAKAGQDMTKMQEARSQQDLDRMLNQASEIRSQFENTRTSLELKFDQLLSETTATSSKLDSLETNQLALTAELRKVEMEIWDMRKIPTNVLISALQGLDAALKSGTKWRIEDFIKRLKTIIKTDFIGSNTLLDEELQGFIEGRLTKLETDYPQDAIEIRQLVAECVYLNTTENKG